MWRGPVKPSESLTSPRLISSNPICLWLLEPEQILQPSRNQRHCRYTVSKEFLRNKPRPCFLWGANARAGIVRPSLRGTALADRPSDPVQQEFHMCRSEVKREAAKTFGVMEHVWNWKRSTQATGISWIFMVFHDCGRSFLGVAQDCGWIRLLDKSHQVTFLPVAIFEMLQDIETPEPTKVLPEYSQRKLLPWLFGKLRKGTIHRPPYHMATAVTVKCGISTTDLWTLTEFLLVPGEQGEQQRAEKAVADIPLMSINTRWTLMTLVFCRV